MAAELKDIKLTERDAVTLPRIRLHWSNDRHQVVELAELSPHYVARALRSMAVRIEIDIANGCLSSTDRKGEQ